MHLLKRLALLLALLLLGGCEQTDVRLATEAGLDAVKAVTLSDAQVAEMAALAAGETDGQHHIAPADDSYARRLALLVGLHQKEENITFNYKVYLDPTINAFAMADGTIRIYSGLMDMMDDGELRFVIGHEMGHVTKKHIKKKLILAYAAQAVRKGVASQQNTAGDIARSGLGSLAETLLSAQFSQQEEREADDYGLQFLQQKGYQADKAISALNKLATLGSNHSFLSSHPDPEVRAERLAYQLAHPEQAKPASNDLTSRILDFLLTLWEKIKGLLTLLMKNFYPESPLPLP